MLVFLGRRGMVMVQIVKNYGGSKILWIRAPSGEIKVSTSTCQGPLLEIGLDRSENRYGRYGFASFPRISISTVGVDGARDSL